MYEKFIKKTNKEFNPNLIILQKSINLLNNIANVLPIKIMNFIGNKITDDNLKLLLPTDLYEQYIKIRHKMCLVEYLLTEIIELAGNETYDNGKIIITNLFIEKAINKDKSLKELFKKIM